MIDEQPERIFQGVGVSGGIAMGPLHVMRESALIRRSFTAAEEETQLLRAAIAQAKTQLEALIEGQDELAGEILEFQLALLDDDDLLAPVFRAIGSGVACDAAWKSVLDVEIADYRRGGDDVLAARAADLTDLRNRVLSLLNGAAVAEAERPEGAILVAADLTPSGFLGLDWPRIGGVVTLRGSPTSHVSILARARGVNLVIGLAAELQDLAERAPAILDAAEGRLIIHPRAETTSAATQRIAAARDRGRAAEALLTRPATTASGEPVKILVNIDEPDRLDALSPEICDGVGLTRTEFLFPGGHQPDEEEQLAFYRRLIAWAQGRPVTIRTLDAGGDKPIPGVTIDGEANPFLGVRGLRLSLAKPDIFRIQLRALARAAASGPINVMFPMVTVPAELVEARRMMREEIAALEQRGVRCATPPMGIMIEVPAAALTAESFDADFYSIGSNDLIQYTLACSRDNSILARLADAANPAIFELIRRTAEAARKRGVSVSICGDMASTPALVGPLLGTGLRVLSCAPAQVGAVKLAVSEYRPQPR
jgi:phosphotransferase system enzyme I (PtsI)